MDLLNHVLALEADEHSALLVPRDAPRNDPVPKSPPFPSFVFMPAMRFKQGGGCPAIFAIGFLELDLVKRLVKTTIVNSHFVSD